MQMGDGLACVRAVVEDQTEAGLAEPDELGNFRRLEQKMAQNFVVFRFGFGHSRNRFLGDDEHVSRSLRFDVVESQDKVVLINDGGRDFAGDDFFKQGLSHRVRIEGRRVLDVEC